MMDWFDEEGWDEGEEPEDPEESEGGEDDPPDEGADDLDGQGPGVEGLEEAPMPESWADIEADDLSDAINVFGERSGITHHHLPSDVDSDVSDLQVELDHLYRQAIEHAEQNEEAQVMPGWDPAPAPPVPRGRMGEQAATGRPAGRFAQESRSGEDVLANEAFDLRNAIRKHLRLTAPEDRAELLDQLHREGYLDDEQYESLLRECEG